MEKLGGAFSALSPHRDAPKLRTEFEIGLRLDPRLTVAGLRCLRTKRAPRHFPRVFD